MTNPDGTTEIRTTQGGQLLPTSSLYHLNTAADSHVLVETDPNFTNQKKWLSSDYMYNALRHDHENVHKRLGDGYYEQRLVREQINQLTGRQFVGEYTDFEEQYKGLMNAGISFANSFNLTLGTKLSAAQVALLTTDIVWLEQETITLSDGSTQTVLVPKVYTVVKEGDLKGDGTLISASNLSVKTNELVNQGTIAGRNIALFNSNKLINNGNLSAGMLSATVNGDLANIGGTITAEQPLLMNVTGNLTHQSTTRTDEVNLDGYRYSDTHIDRKASMYVKGENGTLQVAAGNITVSGADIVNDGNGMAYLNAKTALNLTALSTAHSENVGGGDHYRHSSQTGIAISKVQGKGDVILSGATIATEAAALEAEKKLMLIAENDVVLGTANTSTSRVEHHKYKSGSAVAKTTKTTDLYQATDMTVGSQLSGETVSVMAGGNVNATAVQLVADKELAISAVGNVSISAGTNHFKDEYKETKKTSGVFTSGAGITFGSKSEKHEFDSEGWTQSDARAALGVLNGNVTIQAGKHANILGADLIAQTNNTIAIQGESLKVEAGKDVIETTEKHEYKQSGLTIAVSTSLTDMAMAVADTVQRAKKAKNNKLQSLYAIKAAQDLQNSSDAMSKTTDVIGNIANGNMTVANDKTDMSQPSAKISISVGASQSKQESHTTEVIHSGSELSAGNVKLTTTQGDLDIIGSTVQATKVALDSANNINLESVQDTYQNRTDSKNSGWSVGVFVGMTGNSFGLGLEGSAQVGKGRENTDSTIQYNSYINGEQVSISSKKDTALRGAQINADKLAANINGNLTVESRQDSNHYDSKQTQAGVSAAVAIYGTGTSASASFSQNKAKINYAQVEEQSGFNVGNGGMNVSVEGNTHLKGGLIQSSATEEKNHFSTGTLTTENIENHSEIEVENISAGLSTNMAAMAMNAVGAAVSALGNKHESSTSTTYSAIGTNIDLTTKTGEMPTALSRDTDNANQKVQQYDLTKVQENQEIASLAGQIGATAVGDLAKAMKWEDGSPQKIALHGLVGYLSAQLSGGNGTAGAAAGMTTEWLNTQVENYLLQQEAKGELSDDSRKAIQQASSALIGAVTGGVIGGDRETAAQGATTALNAEKYNRQLHPDERKRIKVLATQLADKYKSTNPTLTEAFWENQLSMVASAMVDQKNNLIATVGLNALADIQFPTVLDNPTAMSYLDSIQISYNLLQKEAAKNQPLAWSDGSNMTLYGENLTMFKATEKQYKDHDMLSSSYSTLLDGVGSVKPNTGISSMSDLGRKLGVTDGNASHTADLLNIISKSKSTNINVLDKVQSDHFSYIDSPNGVVKPVIFEDLLIAGGGKAINWAAGKVISGTNKGLTATGETMAAAMVTDDMIRLGTAAELELSSTLSRLGEKALSSIKWSDTSVKFATTNAIAASAVKSASVAQEYANGKPITSNNLLNSVNDIAWSGGNAFITTGTSLPVGVAISVANDQIKDGKSDVSKSLSSSILGEIIDRYLRRTPMSPYFREVVTQTYENQYKDIKDSYKNDKK